VVVIVDDEETAEVINEVVNNIDPEKTEGIERHFKQSPVKSKTLGMSCSPPLSVMMMTILTMAFTAVFVH